jgi:hypothetical protein
MRLFSSLALITIAYAALTRVNKVHAARSATRATTKPEAVQTWEGEGGGLPTGGPGAGVQVAPAAVHDPDLAHGGV